MRPELLRFSGLRSYQGGAEVDFTDLGLFAIIGDTGSGKSTIIEALSLALYARPTWTGRIDGLVSDGAKNWQVELTFTAGGRRWRVTRRRGQSAAIDKLEELDGTGEKVDKAGQVTERITEIIGLDHSQFISAVVLPQGRFEKLLTAGDTDRTKLLTSILGLDDVEATQRQAKQLVDEWSPKVQTWAALRRELGDDPAAAARAAAERASNAKARAEALGEASERCRALEPQLAAVAGARDRLAERLDSIADVPGDLPAQLDVAQQQWADAQRYADTAGEQLERVAQQQATLDAARREHLAGFADRDELAGAISTARRVVEQLPERLEQAHLARAQLDAARRDTPSAEIDPAVVAAAETADAETDAATTGLREAEEALRRCEGAWDRLVERRRELAGLEERLPDALRVLDEARSQVEAAEKDLSDAEATAATAAAAARAAALASAAERAGAGCEPGDDCPVCARPLPQDYTPPEHHADVEAAHVAEDAARAAVTRARDALTERTRTLERQAAAVDRLQTDLDAARQGEQAAAGTADELGVTTTAEDRHAALAPATAAVQDAARRLDAAKRAAAQATDALSAARSEVERRVREHESQVTSADTAAQHADRAVTELVSELDRVDTASGEEDPAQRAEAALRRLEAARDALAELEEQRRQLDSDARDATERRSAAQDAARDARDAAKELLGPLRARRDTVEQAHRAAAALDGATLPDLPEPLPAVSAPAGLAEVCAGLDRHLAALDAAVAAARDALAETDARRAGLSAELDALLATFGAATSADLHAGAGAATTAADDAEAELERQQAAATKAAALDDRLEVGAPFLSNLRVLQEALRNNMFIAHLVAARETELLAEASQRLSDVTGGRFGFGPGFKVVNRYSGEERRSDALSGGERFQAALALALALMEIASRGSRGRLEAVFIDEGFGSLDSAALEQALERLRSVSGDGTTVALVSHLRAVAEHVSDVLHVTRNDTTGSTVVRLDEDELERMLDDDARSGLTA